MIGEFEQLRRVATASLFIGCLSSVAACSGQSSPSGDSSVSGAPSSAASGVAAATLPDGVPLPTGGELVAAAKPFSGDRAAGWTAVALTPADSTLTAVSTALNQTLVQAGWVGKVTGTETDGFVISGTRTTGLQQQWLNINVTTPVPGSGPAVTYRYASGSTASSTPSASATR